jgi:hypothetical protein
VAVKEVRALIGHCFQQPGKDLRPPSRAVPPPHRRAPPIAGGDGSASARIATVTFSLCPPSESGPGLRTSPNHGLFPRNFDHRVQHPIGKRASKRPSPLFSHPGPQERAAFQSATAIIIRRFSPAVQDRPSIRRTTLSGGPAPRQSAGRSQIDQSNFREVQSRGAGRISSAGTMPRTPVRRYSNNRLPRRRRHLSARPRSTGGQRRRNPRLTIQPA